MFLVRGRNPTKLKFSPNNKDNMKIIQGYIAGHDKKPYLGNVVLDDKGIIKSVNKGVSKKKADLVYDKDHLIFPAMGDVHIHAREDETEKQNYKEDYVTANAAARNGGVVHTCCMPNTPSPVTTTKSFTWHRNRIADLQKEGKVQGEMFNYLGIDKNTKPIGKPGEYFYKLYFGKSVGDLTVTFGDELDTILARYVGQYISFHVEYEPIVLANAKGKTHTDRRPRECVNEGLRLLLPLIQKYKIHAKLCHWSTGGTSFQQIEEYRKKGCDIQLEVSPLHLLFDTSVTDADPSMWLKIQMNPAIQSPADRQELIKALKNNFINFLATDHAPHTLEEKYSAFAKYKGEYPELSNQEIAKKILAKDKREYMDVCCENGHSGAPWLDTYSLVCLWLMKEHKFATQDVVRIACYNPGNFVNRFLKNQTKDYKKFGLGFGQIKKGFAGSFTVLNTKEKTVVKREDVRSKVGWSALEGYEFTGKLSAKIHLGELLA